ncbi:MAG: hypothetical protein JWP75_507 [Frondihabitans sp.]|nr:hypothetical protein [Frondihabitans sp.]
MTSPFMDPDCLITKVCQNACDSRQSHPGPRRLEITEHRHFPINSTSKTDAAPEIRHLVPRL